MIWSSRRTINKLRLGLTLVFCLAFKESWAVPLAVRNVIDINFGEAAIRIPGAPGSITITPTGAVSTINATPLGTFTNGSFTLIGDELMQVVLTLTPGAWACDATYSGACIGAPPALTLTHNFAGTISGNNCPQRPRCIELVGVGGTFAFTGTEQGRWTTNITIIANYQ